MVTHGNLRYRKVLNIEHFVVLYYCHCYCIAAVVFLMILYSRCICQSHGRETTKSRITEEMNHNRTKRNETHTN